jgi:peptide methionine sulfoxide reductase msrA/msrB
MKTNEKAEALKKLNSLQYNVTQKNATEPPFQNDYWNHHEKGIYVDIVSKEALFTSLDKFESPCGWPSFSKSIAKLDNKRDFSHGMIRTEVRTINSDSHLGHLFDDGPKELGSARYCINSAALEFIPYEKLEELGYLEYKWLFEGENNV